MINHFMLSIILITVLLGALLRIYRKYHHRESPRIVGRYFDSRLRKILLPPDKIIRRSEIKAGMQVLEVGCGNGAYTIPIARILGQKGLVCALDIQQKFLEQIKKKLTRPENTAAKNNIKLIQGNAHQLPFRNNSFDIVYLVCALQEIPDKNKALQEITRVLKPDGIVAITESIEDPDYVLKSTTINFVGQSGLLVEKIFSGLWSYTIRFNKGLRRN